jgi:hypothetical protein
MWRLWTKGWYISGWWAWICESFPMWIAWYLPRRIALWAFIRVYAFANYNTGPEYDRICKAWESGKRP